MTDPSRSGREWTRPLLTALLAWALAGCALVNPGVIQEIETNPDGDRAASTLVMTLDDGTRLPLNFVREDNRVYLGSGGRWWRRFETPAPVTLLIRGRQYRGTAVAVRDDPDKRMEVFKQLRPSGTAWLKGVLVAVTLDDAEE